MAAGSDLQKAKIKIYRTPVEEISCLFNPAEYKISSSAGYSSKKQSQNDASLTQYTGGYQSTLSFTLYYDITGQLPDNPGVRQRTSVRDYTAVIEQLLLVEGSEHKPPELAFIWGDLAFRGYLTSLNQDYTYFDHTGKPLRAKLDLSILEAPAADRGRESPLESPDRTKRRIVAEGMSLWLLAFEEYGDCNRWVEIAEYNGLMNPLDLVPGQILRLPPL